MERAAQARRRAAAFDQLAREHLPRLYRLGLGFCGNHADAQDLAQETLLQAFRKWEQFEGRAQPATWLYRIASRLCQRMRRRRAGQPAHLESLDADPALAADVERVRAPREERPADDLAALQGAILDLPPDFRLPLVLKEISGCSVEETAALLGLKPETVKTRLHRARLRVRDQLGPARAPPAAGPGAYDQQVCRDLLRAKQDALDRGVDFPVANALLCAHCRTVFAALDQDQALCQQLGRGPLPAVLRELIATPPSTVAAAPRPRRAKR